MKTNKTEFVKFRLSPQERSKYKHAAHEVGLTLSGFLRYSASRAIKSIEKDLF